MNAYIVCTSQHSTCFGATDLQSFASSKFLSFYYNVIGRNNNEVLNLMTRLWCGFVLKSST